MADLKVTGVILAGGRSRRLGQDKVRLELAGRPLGRWVWEGLSPLVSECWLVGNRPLEHISLGLPFLIDLFPGRGTLGGLLSAMLVARGDCVMLSACDMPFLQPSLLRAMLLYARQGSPEVVVCRSSRGLEPLPGVFSRRLLLRLEHRVERGELRLRTFLDACRTRVLSAAEVASHDPAELSFFNLNTPQDLLRARALASCLDQPDASLPL
ncbi:MAG TPA: hypothetical protein DCY27_11305 [Desulfobacterales bacterium]|nr:hypothetical protein [Desulfobacterales bacterium]